MIRNSVTFNQYTTRRDVERQSNFIALKTMRLAELMSRNSLYLLLIPVVGKALDEAMHMAQCDNVYCSRRLANV